MEQTEPIDALALIRGMPDPAKVAALEAQALGLPQVDLQTVNLIHGDMCARTILIPAGTGLTGAQTNADNICILFGDILVTTDEGSQRLTGYHVLPAVKGSKRAGVAFADTYWTTIWPTTLTDIDAIEDEMFVESGMLQTRRASFLAQQDYHQWVVESGLSEQFIAAALAFTDDLVETPDCLVNLRKGPSEIEGTGVFATRDLAPGETIAPARRFGLRCVAGRYTNHSPQPNAQFIADGDELTLIAVSHIADGDEVTVDYRQAVAVNTTFQGVQQ